MSDEESRVIDAAVAFVETEIYSGRIHMDLIEAVRDMQRAIKKTSMGDGEGQVCS